ncbi:hypothetical protein IV203_032878 [Nitzschia inconspicua]|uniref:Uncharacterized protein n=1 Tax=Nitzschia inconspicua TaxID=303405 RepID=A0A9K3KKF1_9STRA|nr:hypothetical protein IV203_032878 [Nitzschia inconspicua]
MLKIQSLRIPANLLTWNMANIPEAATLTWKDGFFDDDTEDLVAVFDHDRKAMLTYAMKVAILTRIVPWTITLLTFAILFSIGVRNIKNSWEDCESSLSSNFYNTYRCQYGVNQNALAAYQLIRALLLVLMFLHGFLALYGYYRIAKSTIYALHLAVVRDGIRFVHDNHIESRSGIIAALHIFDQCLLVSKKSETASTTQVFLSMAYAISS